MFSIFANNANNVVPNTPGGSFYNKFGAESELDFIKRHLEGDTVDMSRAFANNPEKNHFLNECFNVACEFGYINTVTQMLKYASLRDHIDNHNAYYAGKGGNIEIIKMVTKACMNSYILEYENKPKRTTATKPFNYEQTVWLSCIGGACKGNCVDAVKFYLNKIRNIGLLTYFGIFVDRGYNFETASELEQNEMINDIMKNGVMYHSKCVEVIYFKNNVYCF